MSRQTKAAVGIGAIVLWAVLVARVSLLGGLGVLLVGFAGWVVLLRATHPLGSGRPALTDLAPGAGELQLGAGAPTDERLRDGDAARGGVVVGDRPASPGAGAEPDTLRQSEASAVRPMDEAERLRVVREREERSAAERRAKEQRAERRAAERRAREEEARKQREQAKAERAERERAAAGRAAAERDRAAAEQAERERAERERAEVERAAAEQAERERAERERAERERAEVERAAAEQAERERAEVERAAAEQAERERAAAEQAEREQAERDRAAARQATPDLPDTDDDILSASEQAALSDQEGTDVDDKESLTYLLNKVRIRLSDYE